MTGRSWNDASYLSSSLDNAYSGMSKGYGDRQSAGRAYSSSYNNNSSYNPRTGRQNHASLYDSLGRHGYEDSVARHGSAGYGYRSQSDGLSSRWRSRSSDSYNDLLERSTSRQAVASRDYSTLGRDTSMIRDRLRDRSSSNRTYTPPGDYSRIRSTGRDPYPLPPISSAKSPDLHSILVKPSAYTTSRFHNSNINSTSRSRSSFDLNESVPSSQRVPKSRKRNQTLTLGISESDLERARSVVSSAGRLSDNLGVSAPITSESYTRKSTFRHSLPDVFDSLSYSSQDLGYSSLNKPSRFYSKVPPSSISSSGSAHVSFLSPESESIQLPSCSSSVTSSIPTFPSSMSPINLSPSFTNFQQQSNLQPPLSLSSTLQPSCSPKPLYQEDETLKLLQKHYLDAILTLAPQKKTNDTATRSQTNEKYEILEIGDQKSNQPTQVIDDILKLWEESQAENSRLRLEMNSLRLELEATKNQVENAIQVRFKFYSKFHPSLFPLLT